jgi:pilus assembly protein CpaB
MQQAASVRPRNADWRILAAALVLAAIAAGLIVAYLASRGSSSSEPAAPIVEEPVPVVVAIQEIPGGTLVTEEMVELRYYPEETLPEGAMPATDLVVGQVTRFPIAAGEQLTISRFVGPSSGQSISFQIPEGLRGFTIPVDVRSSPASLLVPGDFVDVIVLLDIELLGLQPVLGLSEDRDYKGAYTIFQNLQVISVQREYVEGVPYEPSVRGDLPEEGDISYVTLAVEPEDAQLLWLASSQGSVTLSLRPFGDEDVTPLAPIAEPLQLPALATE